MGDVLRTEQDIPQHWPRWYVQFAKRIAALERGKVYELMLVMPDGNGDPQWFVKEGRKLESGR